MDAVVLYPQIGTKEDAADASGSLHAKLKNIVDNVLPTLQKPRGTLTTNYNSSSTSLTPVLSISGKGKLISIVNVNVNSSGDHADYKITIDGNVIAFCDTDSGGYQAIDNYYAKTLSPLALQGSNYVEHGFSPAKGTTEPTLAIPALEFKSSLLVEVAKKGANTVRGTVTYCKE